MTERWDVNVPCPRKSCPTRGADHASEVTCKGCEPCEGQVRVYGYSDPGSTYSPDTAYPPEGEDNADPCDTCGYEDWTDAELQKMTDEARR